MQCTAVQCRETFQAPDRSAVDFQGVLVVCAYCQFWAYQFLHTFDTSNQSRSRKVSQQEAPGWAGGGRVPPRYALLYHIIASPSGSSPFFAGFFCGCAHPPWQCSRLHSSWRDDRRPIGACLWPCAVYIGRSDLPQHLQGVHRCSAAAHRTGRCRRRQPPPCACVTIPCLPVPTPRWQISYTALARFTYQKSGNAVWQALQPALKNQLTWLESIFGAPATFTPTTTHVILVAILLVLMVNAEGGRRR